MLCFFNVTGCFFVDKEPISYHRGRLHAYMTAPACSHCFLQVTYNDKMVLPGDQLSINDIADEPKVEITEYSPTAVYSLLMLDPDMPSPHKPEHK